MESLTPHDPQRIGRYRLVGRLGGGGMGMVYVARSDRGRMVAVKTIRSELAQEPDFRRRFAQEITAARRVGGQWTAPVLDADIDAETPWVATGFIAGPSLYQVVSDHGPLPERTVRLLAGGMARALEAIHGVGLVHRDLKPSNVLLTLDGPRVIDFGIARALERAPGETITRTGSVVGSPGFMSPEQVRGQRLSPASDVFGLGALLVFAASGRTPFGALDTDQHILMYRTVEDRPDLALVPEGLHPLLNGCLTRQPEQRTPLSELLAHPAPGGGEDPGPWLPAEVVDRVGRDAVLLLESETPRTRAVPRLPEKARPDAAGPSGQAGGSADRSPNRSAGGSAQAGTPSAAHQPARPDAPGTPPEPASPPPSPYAPAPVAGAAVASPGAASAGGPGSGPRSPLPGGFGPPSASGFAASPYDPTAPMPRPGRGRRRGLLAALAAVVGLAVLGVVAVVALSGDDEGTPSGQGQGQGNGSADDDHAADTDTDADTEADPAPVADAFLGTWQGQWGTPGRMGWKNLWLEIHQGVVGETIGVATVTYTDETCVYDVRLESASDDRLRYTEHLGHSVPEAAVRENCRADGTVKTLELQNDGALAWGNADQQASLQPVEVDTASLVPASLVGSWHDEFETDEERNNVDDVTIEQGGIGDTVMRWAWTRGDLHCVAENQLAAVDGDRILLSPDILLPEDSDSDCSPADNTAWLWVDDGGVLRLVWTDEPDEEPYEIEND
ncbi:serine/threonine protein kinase [Streptomyces sp. 4N509B]|uniref:serine/threonine protein kinase n=1 Tax=Streptomyces sp. 4N509B TaxID=3457413 RepID=UPI003FD386B3